MVNARAYVTAGHTLSRMMQSRVHDEQQHDFRGNVCKEPLGIAVR